MTNPIKVSVIVPVYNVERYLRECLDSAVNQTLREIEIICVNDGSTDGSLEILNEYAAKDARVKIISKPNSGYGHTMNVGLEAAAGRYIGILESDDYLTEDMYENLYHIAEDNRADFVKADFYRFVCGADGKLATAYNRLSENPAHYNRVLNPADDPSLFSLIMNTWSGIYSTEFLRKHNIKHNETPGASFQDTGFWFQTFCLAERVYFVDKPYYMNRRDNPDSSVHNKQKIYAPCDEYEYIYSFLERNPEIKKRFTGVYAFYRYKGYMASYNRSAEELRREFMLRFQKDFIKLRERGELPEGAFSKGAWNYLQMIMADPLKVYAEDAKQRETLRANPGNKLLGFYYCWKDHGFMYTCKHAVKKVFSR